MWTAGGSEWGTGGATTGRNALWSSQFLLSHTVHSASLCVVLLWYRHWRCRVDVIGGEVAVAQDDSCCVGSPDSAGWRAGKLICTSSTPGMFFIRFFYN
jgi:hypothetical protein